MHSRAYLLIKRDLYLLEKNPVNGIHIERIDDDNCFDLTLYLRPGKTSIWYGCLFRIFCSFYDTYNVQPPILQFDSIHIPYHPNVDPITGRISLSTIEQWNPNFTLKALFDELISVFILPNEHTIINSDAMRMLKYRSNDYHEMIDSSINKSRQLVDSINEENASTHRSQLVLPRITEANRARLHTPERGTRRRQPTNFSFNQRISFEDYLNTWKGIATSKAKPQEQNPLLNQLGLQPKLQAQHLALNANELAQQLDDRALQFVRLKYGKLTNDEHERKPTELSQISSHINDQPIHIVTEANSSVDILTNPIEHFTELKQEDISIQNDEVDQLIEWTQCLPTTDEHVEDNVQL